MIRNLFLASVAGLMTASAPPITFTPMPADLAPAATEYRRLWCGDGARIVATMERVTGFRFPEAPIEVFVAPGRPMTAYDGRTIWLKASYSAAYKQATLVHELGHRLALTMPRAAGLDDHRLIYLFLYDVWSELYGSAFAERMVAIERHIPGRYDYDAAWTWALSLTRDQRQARLSAIRSAAVAPAPAATGPPPGCGA